jgi:hypothetical protein
VDVKVNSDQLWATFNLGADLRFELLPGHRLSPYLAGGINYMRSPYLVADKTATPSRPGCRAARRYRTRART